MRWSFTLMLAMLVVLTMAIEIVEAGKTTSSSTKKTTTSKKTTTTSKKTSTTTKKTTKTTTTSKSKKTTATTTKTLKDDQKDVVNPGIYTSWITVYETVNDCGPFTTTVTPCNICTPCVITAYDQCITSTTTSTWPTSTYCPTPGWYDECSCQISQPQWIWYNVPCEVEYSCPYQEWYFMDEKDVDCVVKVNGEICDEKKEKWTVTLSKTITKTVTDYPKSKSTGRPSKKSSQRGSIKPTSRPLPPPSSKPQSYTIKPTQRPSSGSPPPPASTSSYPPSPPRSSSAPAPAPASSAGPAPAPAPAPGSPVSTFKLTTTIDGSDAVIMQESGLLVLTPATNSTEDVAFTLTSTGELMTSDGEYVYLTIADGVGGDFQYGAFSDKRKRAVDDGTYYGAFSFESGGLSMVINGTSMAIQSCGDGNVLGGSVGIMSGCNPVTMQSAPVDSTNTTTSTTSSPTGSATGSASGTGSATGSVSTTGSATASAMGSTGSISSSPSATGSPSGSNDPSTPSTTSSPSVSGTSAPSTSGSGTSSPSSPAPSTTGSVDGGSSTTGSPSVTSDGPSGTGSTTSDPSGSPTDSGSSSVPTTTDGPTYGNGTNSTTEARRARMVKAMKFKYI